LLRHLRRVLAVSRSGRFCGTARGRVVRWILINGAAYWPGR